MSLSWVAAEFDPPLGQLAEMSLSLQTPLNFVILQLQGDSYPKLLDDAYGGRVYVSSTTYGDPLNPNGPPLAREGKSQ